MAFDVGATPSTDGVRVLDIATCAYNLLQQMFEGVGRDECVIFLHVQLA